MVAASCASALALLSGFAGLSGCGGAVSVPSPPKASAISVAPAAMITPARLVPEVDGGHLDAWFSEQGRDKHLLAGLRIVVHDSGRVERADERFPSGAVSAQELPERLGGGYLFYQADTQGTRLWRAPDWTSKLVPLVHVGPAIADVTAGFDRLYLRTRTNQLMAVDAGSGDILPLGQLPPSSGFVRMVFADGWRAVVDVDLRGPLATFDAGASWWPLGIEQAVVAAGLRDGDPVLYVDDGYYRLDADGHLQLVRSADEADDDVSAVVGDEVAEHGQGHPLGDRPLRVAVERGYPDTTSTAVVLHRGALVRVKLPDGDVLGVRPDAIEDDTASCQGVRVGKGFGFVCGVEGGSTTIYRYLDKMRVELVARFESPRFVSSSGNGSLVVRGRCEGREASLPDMRTYCVVAADGGRREVAVRGEVGAERVVALADGRVVVLVPPRLGQPGRLTLIDGDKLTAVDLRYPEEPRRAVKVARRGLWQEGFQQRGKDAVAGWVEAGGPVVGVKVKLDGQVEVGAVYDEGGDVLTSGLFALGVNDTESGYESIDGGKTWRDLEIPRLPESPGDAKTRGCSAVGCALRGWLRVGWGDSEVKGDLESVEAPPSASVRQTAAQSLRLRCEAVAGSGPRAQEPGPPSPYSTWVPFRGTPPPKLGKDEVGVDKFSMTYDDVPVHVYVWGPRGADWTRAGWWMVRFDDRFDPLSGVRSSALTRPPWGDEVSAAEAIGARRHGSYWRWEAEMDPAGQAAIANLCTGSQCLPYAVSDGRPVMPLTLAQGVTATFNRPAPHGVARVGESWYFLSEVPGVGTITLWRAELGVMRPLAMLRRLDQRQYQSTSVPQLVRRVHGGELGVLVTAAADPSTGSQVGSWMVLPIDPGSGALGEPVPLGDDDLGGVVPPVCGEHDDGWLLSTRLPMTPSTELVGAYGYVDEVDLRLRLEPGSRCIEAIAARAGRELVLNPEAGGRALAAGPRIPMSVRERYGGQRWQLGCVGVE